MFLLSLLCQEAQPAPIEEDNQHVTKKEMDEVRKQYIEEKSYTVVRMWECEWY